jgi:cellulose synthase/poly-beta-1,6-N-acetylglucosamine synthase-like glycosyltransferase
MHTVGNTAKKAGALNQALTRLLPYLCDNDQVLVMDADSHLNPAWLAAATDALCPGAGRRCRVRRVPR